MIWFDLGSTKRFVLGSPCPRTPCSRRRLVANGPSHLVQGALRWRGIFGDESLNVDARCRPCLARAGLALPTEPVELAPDRLRAPAPKTNLARGPHLRSTSLGDNLELSMFWLAGRGGQYLEPAGSSPVAILHLQINTSFYFGAFGYPKGLPYVSTLWLTLLALAHSWS